MEIKLEDAFKNKKIKTIIDFDRKECNSIKPIALKVNMNQRNFEIYQWKNANVCKNFAKMFCIRHD